MILDLYIRKPHMKNQIIYPKKGSTYVSLTFQKHGIHLHRLPTHKQKIATKSKIIFLKGKSNNNLVDKKEKEMGKKKKNSLSLRYFCKKKKKIESVW